MNLWTVEAPPLDVWGQLALDEWLLNRPDGDFHLRFHRWEGGPAASFGYAMRRADAERTLDPHLRANCARRLTGGGVMRHGADVTFSCAFPYPASQGVWNPLAVYRTIQEAIGRGFQEAGFDVCLLATPVMPRHPHYFNPMRPPVALELMGLDGTNLLWAALRRRRTRVLYEGTIRMAGARTRSAEIEMAVRRGFEMASHRDGWTPMEWSPDPVFAALRDKYRSAEWLSLR